MKKADPKQIFDVEKLRATKPRQNPEQLENEEQQQKKEDKNEQ